MMKGIILAGGEATRVRPAQDKTQQIIYDKPVLFYLLANVMKAGIRDVLIVCNHQNVITAQALFRYAEWEFGVNVRFATISVADGPAGPLRLKPVRHFAAGSPVCLMLDGIYDGGNFDELARHGAEVTAGATIIVAERSDPRPFGWIRMDPARKRIIDIIEKPRSTYDDKPPFLVQTHMYFYGPEVFEMADSLQKSDRGEYEVTDLHKLFLSAGKLNWAMLRETAQRRLIWDDAGTARRLLDLAITVQRIQESGLKTLIGSPHLQALDNGWIDLDRVFEICEPFLGKGIEYYDTLCDIARERASMLNPGV